MDAAAHNTKAMHPAARSPTLQHLLARLDENAADQARLSPRSYHQRVRVGQPGTCNRGGRI